jgi:hypothetical protein
MYKNLCYNKCSYATAPMYIQSYEDIFVTQIFNQVFYKAESRVLQYRSVHAPYLYRPEE